MVDVILEKFINDMFHSKIAYINWITYQIAIVRDNKCNEYVFVRYLNNIIIFKNDKYIKTIKK